MKRALKVEPAALVAEGGRKVRSTVVAGARYPLDLRPSIEFEFEVA
jgi:hypothetical protein